MNCSKCGAPLKEGAKFCTKCGAKVQTSDAPAEQSNNKGIIDNITHLGTFLQRGSRGVEREIRQENRERIQQEAEALGLEVRKPQHGRDHETEPEKPRERRLHVAEHTFGNPTAETLDVVSGRAIWSINPGEVARRITEREFANVEGLRGVIVQEGCTALVYIDGQMVSMMQAGCYTFPAKTQTEIKLEQREKELKQEKTEFEKLKKQMEQEQRKEAEEYAKTFASRGVFGEVASFGRGVMNFLFGKKKDEKPEVHKARMQRVEKKLRALPSPKICRVYIVSDRIINLLFGCKEENGVIEFVPMTIPAKLFDLEVAVSMQLQISNMTAFVSNYLADKNTLSVTDIHNELATSVKTILTNLLRNLDYEAEGLPEPVVNNLKARIQASCNERLQGIEVLRVVDITDRSADFERFRQVERELYAGEKELGFLQRTNEFRNRLEQEQNKPAINSARNAEELRQALQAINKDKLISEDEMEQFVLLLESQKRLREATTKEQEYEALMDLKKSRLVKDDDIAALENALAQGQITRENVTDVMRIQASQKVRMSQQIADFEFADSEREHQLADALRRARHEGDLTSAQIDTQRLIDAYDDNRKEVDWNRAQKEQQAANDQALFELEMREKEAKAQYERERETRQDAHKNEMDRMAQLIAARDKAMAEMNRHEESVHQMDTNVEINRDNNFATMSADQIRAAQLSHLDKDAQVAMAQAYSHDEANALLKEQAAKDEQRRKEDFDRMERMMEKMQSGMLGMAGVQMATQQQRYDEQVALKQEYQQQAQHAQARQDTTQQQALESVSGVAGAAASNLGAFNGGFSGAAPQPAYQPKAIICPACGNEVPEGETYCPECGQKVK